MISSSNLTNIDRTFRRLSLLTVLIIYLLILVGGIVRSTGSGMGCPDWPKCFGQWIPPTDVSQLPTNYQEIYSHRGYASTTFNPIKTWIEYLNRLLGVLTGFFIFFTFVSSLRYIKRDKPVTVISFIAFILVGVQGWLGSVVVKTVLSPWIVTLHMMLAIIIVGLLLYVVARTYAKRIPAVLNIDKSKINRIIIISTGLLIIQIVLGTQVRQLVDHTAKLLGGASRDQWLITIGKPFFIHRSFSILVFVVQLLWIWQLRKLNQYNFLVRLANWVMIVTAANIITGIIMAYFSIPSFAQPLHLTLAVSALGIQFIILLLMNKEKLAPDHAITYADLVTEA